MACNSLENSTNKLLKEGTIDQNGVIVNEDIFDQLNIEFTNIAKDVYNIKFQKNFRHKKEPYTTKCKTIFLDSKSNYLNPPSFFNTLSYRFLN